MLAGLLVTTPAAHADLDIRVLVEQYQRRQAEAASRETPLNTLTPAPAGPAASGQQALQRTPGADSAEALFARAVRHDTGDGVAIDYTEAARLYRAAAEKGHVRAHTNLGLMHAQGQGVARSDLEAARWLKPAAEAGDDLAQYSLGLMHYEGRGVRQDHGAALTWYRAAARQGNVKAMNNLGIMYALGHGVPSSATEAYAWFAVAAQTGDADAVSNRDLTAGSLSASQLEQARQAYARLRGELGRAE